MAGSCWLEQGLQVAVGPLPKSPVGSHDASRVERFAQVNHESLPLRLGDLAVEGGCSPDADGEAEKPSRRGKLAASQCASGLRNTLRCDPRFPADVLQLRQGHSLAGRERTARRLFRIGRQFENLCDLVFGVAALRHMRGKNVGMGQGSQWTRALPESPPLRKFYSVQIVRQTMPADGSSSCLRCSAALPDAALFCHRCGVAVAAAATGEFPAYDMERFFNYALDMLCIAGTDGYFKLVNPAFERTLGYTATELFARPFVELLHPDDRQETVAEVGRLVSGQPTISFENRYRRKDGAYRVFQWKAFPEPGTGLIYAIARDITDQRDRQTRIDGLTGLATDHVFERVLPREWNRARRLKLPMSLVSLDVDHMRKINDRHGIAVGDRCLAEIGKLVGAHARRACDLAARTGGQRFSVLLTGEATATAGALAEALKQKVAALEIPGAGEGGDATITASVAVVTRDPAGDMLSATLLAATEGALKEAKGKGGNNVVVA